MGLNAISLICFMFSHCPELLLSQCVSLCGSFLSQETESQALQLLNKQCLSMKHHSIDK